jgi:hypothetical protein
LSEQRSLSDQGAFEAALRDKSAEPGGRVSTLLVQNSGGSWLSVAAQSARMGIAHLHVWQPFKSDLLSTDKRVVMVATESDLCFVPNYKCGYSSMRELFCDEFPSCERKSLESGRSSSALNQRISIGALRDYFKFSIIRDPASRFSSFFADKFYRAKGHNNRSKFLAVYSTLLGPSGLNPWGVLELVSKIPAPFADPHWLPVYDNLFLHGVPLVDAIYDIRSTNLLVKDLAKHLNRPIEMPHVLKSGHLGASGARDILNSEAFQSAVRAAYASDSELYARLTEAGGYLSL